ncbi:hypothetical protein MHYP_G00143210 [Metynnis hypsauchen]
MQETSVVNVYKPPLTALTIALPPVPAPAIYAGDFNCQHTDWGYNHTSHDSVALSSLVHTTGHPSSITRRTGWTEVVESIDFTLSSPKAWQTINLLSGRRTTQRRCAVTADAIASQLQKNVCFPEADKNFTRLTSCEVLSLSRAASADANLSEDFTAAGLSAAINKLKPGKSPGQDNTHPEFVIHQSDKTSHWLYSFFSACFRRAKLQKIWHRASIIALPKSNKPTEDPKSYRPISLLCVPYKILDRLIHSHTELVVDPQLPLEQASFR